MQIHTYTYIHILYVQIVILHVSRLYNTYELSICVWELCQCDACVRACVRVCIHQYFLFGWHDNVDGYKRKEQGQ